MRHGDEPSGHPIVPRFLDLLEAGWDAHLVAVGGRSAETEDIPADARGRVHEAAPGAAPEDDERPAQATAADGSDAHVARGRARAATRALSDHQLGSRVGEKSAVGSAQTRLVAGFSGHDLDGQPFERLWSTASGFHFESEALAEFARRSGMTGTTVSVVPPLADAELLARPPKGEVGRAELRMLSVGPLSWTQGFDHALAAVRLLRERGLACHYRIVGAGEYEDAVSFARYQLGVEENVELVRPTGRRGLREQLDWADVLVVAAVVPTSPTVVLDAQAAGLAVVTTEAPPAGADGAIVVPRRDASALADALARIATDMDLRRRLAEAGRRAATASQDLDDQLRRFRDLYRTVLSAGE